MAGFAPAAPRAARKAKAGKLGCEDKWDRSQEAPLAPRTGWEQVAGAGPSALCQDVEPGSRRPRLPRPLPSLPSPAFPGGCKPGRPGNVAGTARNVPLGTDWLEGGERVTAKVREPRSGAGAAPQLQAGEGCFQRGAFRPGERFILPRRPWRWGAGWACVQKKRGRGGQSLPEPVLIGAESPAFRDADLGVRLCSAPRAHRRCAAGSVPGPGLTKGASLHPTRGAAPEKWSLASGS